MAKREDTTYFEKKLLEFVGTKDPMLEYNELIKPHNKRRRIKV